MFLEVLLLGDLGNGHQGPEVIISLVPAAGQDEHDFDLVGSVREIDAVTGADEQDVKFMLPLDHDVRDGKARLYDCAALCFTMEEFLKKDIFIGPKFLGQNGREFAEDIFGAYFAFDIQDLTFSNEPVESILDDFIPLLI